jgi:calcineurin-like phosphoesterase family protein
MYFTADLHLGHERIIELCDRPYSGVAEMNGAIIEGINSTVGSRNTLVILGDVVLGKFEETLALLKEIRAARVLIVPGNHDRFSLAYGHRGAVEAQRTKRRLWMAEYESQRRNGSLVCLEDRVTSQWTARVAGRRVMLSHYPYRGDSIMGPQGEIVDRHRHLRPRDGGLPLIHGHVHGRWRELGRMLNVGVDVNGYRPVAEADIADWLADVPTSVVRAEPVA